MKQLTALLLCLALLLLPAGAVQPQVEAGAAVLMERETGTVLYESHGHDRLEPASVTKIMTLLLVMEALDAGRLALTDPVTVSARAASMGGSQVYLKENERMTVHELLKAVAVVSGNDAAVALAEHLSGSEESFVEAMNTRAAQLGMGDTTFLNCTGLPAAGHLTSAWDIALMSRALLSHPAIRDYTTIWMDSIRNGAFQLSNTNKLIRFYEGATGLKTGSTDAAGYCLSASAEREGMELIAVVLHAPTSKARFEGAKALLNHGFAAYTLVDIHPDRALPPIEVRLGEVGQVQPRLAGTSRLLLGREEVNGVETELILAPFVQAPVEAGAELGTLLVRVGGEERGRIPVVAEKFVGRISFFGVFLRLSQLLFLGRPLDF